MLTLRMKKGPYVGTQKIMKHVTRDTDTDIRHQETKIWFTTKTWATQFEET
jgi:hypothetical protein